MNRRSIFCCAGVALLSACVSTNPPTDQLETPYFEVGNANFLEIAKQSTAFDKDRAAILAMRGEYRVDFHFRETVQLKAGYERHAAKDSGGYETVIVVEDSPDAVVLQHILVGPGGVVVKHWRQDWRYEAQSRFEFVADQSWEVRAVDSGIRKRHLDAVCVRGI